MTECSYIEVRNYTYAQNVSYLHTDKHVYTNILCTYIRYKDNGAICMQADTHVLVISCPGVLQQKYSADCISSPSGQSALYFLL